MRTPALPSTAPPPPPSARAVHPGFVQTSLGIETAEGAFADRDAYASAKAGWGAVTLDEGTDTLWWSIVASDAEVPSGRLYFKRAPHSW
jgi:hypothetical protein